MPHGQDSSVVVAGGQYAMKQKHRLFGFIWGITLFSPLSISINFRWTPRLSSDSSSFFLRPSMNFCISWVWRCALLLCWGYLSRLFEPSVGCSTCGCFSSVSSKLLWGLNIVFGCFCFYITYIIVDEWAHILDPYPAHQATSSHLTRKKQVYNL